MLPPLLYLHLRPLSRARRRAWTAGAPVAAPAPRAAAPLRGALALVLRSVASADARLNYCGAAADAGRRYAALARLRLRDL